MRFFELDGLTKRFGGLTATDAVSFGVDEGEIVGLIGPNGAGKTTLVRLILGILKPDRGRVVFKGENLNRLATWDRVRRGVVGTFQTTRPFKNLPIIANVMVACYSPRSAVRGETEAAVRARALQALTFAGIAELALEQASALSQGDLKRLEVARAIANRPELLILDEPFGGLTESETVSMAQALRELQAQTGCGMIVIEHKLAELMKLVDKVVVVNFGQVLKIGPPDEVVRDKAVIEAYLGQDDAAGTHAA